MNTVHFIHSQIPLKDKATSRVPPLSPAQPCLADVIYPLRSKLPCSFHNQPLRVAEGNMGPAENHWMVAKYLR